MDDFYAARTANMAALPWPNFAPPFSGAVEKLATGESGRLVEGGVADDRLHGGRGDDVIRGGAGNDVLSGGTGNDLLIGGAGNDTLIGGEGEDIFLGNPSDLDGDIIMDFSHEDRIVITDSAFNASALRFLSDERLLELDVNGDGNVNSTLVIHGDFRFDELGIKSDGTDTIIGYFDSDHSGISVPPQTTADTADAETSDEVAADMVQFIGRVLDRSGNGLEGTTVTFNSENSEEYSIATDGSGISTFSLGRETAGTIDATRGYNPETDGSITAADALNVLRLSVGLPPAWGKADAMDFIAADINQDGQVTAADALSILRAAVGLESEIQPRWIFFSSDVDLEGISAKNAKIETAIQVDPLETGLTELSMTGVLLGNMQEHV